MTRNSPDFQILKFVITLFLGWKIIITLIAFFGVSFLPTQLPGEEFRMAGMAVDFWGKWANWDGGHFRGIAENGYLPYQVVFFPFYPLLIKALMFIGIHSLWGGLLVSNLSIIGALFYLYKLVNLDFEEKVSKRVIFLTLAFPTAFYFNAVYSESLFLFLTVTAFYYARTKKWLISLLIASLSAVTRLTGLVVILAVALEYFLSTTELPSVKQFWSEFLNRIASYLLLLAFLIGILHRSFVDYELYLLAGLSAALAVFLTLVSIILLSVFFFKFTIRYIEFKKFLRKPILALLLAFIPFFVYCLSLYYSQDNFLAFVAQEKRWERDLSLPWSAPINYVRHLVEVGVFEVGKPALGLLELIFFVFFVVIFGFSYLKLRLSYTVFFALSLLIPITTGTLQAVHRYGLVIFPVFILLALIKNEMLQQLWIFFSLTLLGILTVMFINGYWVS